MSKKVMLSFLCIILYVLLTISVFAEIQKKQELNYYWRQTDDSDYCFWTVEALAEKRLLSLPRNDSPS